MSVGNVSGNVIGWEALINYWENILVVFYHWSFNWPNGVFPKSFIKFCDKNICLYSKTVRTCNSVTSCVRDQDATAVPAKTQVKDMIFKLSPIHVSLIFRFPEFKWILNASVRGRVSSSRTRFWTLLNLYSEVSKPKILLFSYWFFMQIGWTAFTAWISLGIGLCGHFRIKVRKCPNTRTLPN